MKHPKYKGIGTLDAEIERCQRELLNKEIDFDLMVHKLKNANPSVDDIHKLRQQLWSKEKQVLKARRQLKAKKEQKTRKINQRQHIKFGG
ncbi:TPA: hypothetical protein PXM33_000166 [Yersinia enterocolitica]|nr:hypothetical protein [Yersinia enterocolitica]